MKDRTLLEDDFYADLYQRHAPGLFAYAYRQTASREDAEDQTELGGAWIRRARLDAGLLCRLWLDQL